LVEAGRARYLDPTLLPLLTMPPGKGRMTSGIDRIAATALSAAASVAPGEVPR